jgi:phosphonate transport system substrate-binding protein
MIRNIIKYISCIALAAVLTLPVLSPAAEVKELNFGIISTESSVGLKSVWAPFLQDMEKKLGIKVNAFFASDYAGIIEAMRFNKIQLAWYGNKSAMEAVDRANAEIFVQTVDMNGYPGYWSLLITHKDSNIKSVDDIIKNGKNYTFGNGDPNSTSGYLVPGYYIFALNNIDPAKHFKRTVNSNHETNALAVATKQVDFATNNTLDLNRLKKTHPEYYNKIRIFWKSPLIPNDPIVWRKDLPEDLKAKIKAYFVNYGKTEQERKIIAEVHEWGSFKESNNNQLNPIRQIELFKQKVKLENDDKMNAEEKSIKLAKINADLKELRKLAPAE